MRDTSLADEGAAYKRFVGTMIQISSTQTGKMKLYLILALSIVVVQICRAEGNAGSKEYRCPAVEPKTICRYQNSADCLSFCAFKTRPNLETGPVGVTGWPCPYTDPPVFCPSISINYCTNFCSNAERNQASR